MHAGSLRMDILNCCNQAITLIVPTGPILGVFTGNTEVIPK